MTSALANESELYFEFGGPAYRLMQRLGVIQGAGPSLGRRTCWFLAITWVPLLLFSLAEGWALGPTSRQSFLLDFATYARFFIALPLMFVAEVVVGPRLRTTGLHFVQAGFVREEDYAELERVIAQVVRWRESHWVEILLLGLALFAGWTFSPDALYGSNASSWVAVPGADGLQFTRAGLWYKLVSVPIIHFVLLRWLWRLFLWTRFLWAIAQMDLDLVPTHADEAGGLGFLGVAHVSQGIFAFAASSILSADAAFRLVFEGVPIEMFKGTAIVMLVAAELICLGPLLMFAPIMGRKRREALHEYSLLVDRYNRGFHDKWITGRVPAGESLLGSADIQSLADLGNSYDVIRRMKVVPFSTRVLLQIAMVAAAPAAPLLPLVMPWQDILQMISTAVF